MIEEAKALGRGDGDKAKGDLGKAAEKWRDAAKTWRLPYWDWASEPRLPELVRNEDITIIDGWVQGSQPTTTTVPNPMYRFRMPGGAAMGDPIYGDYRVDGNEDGPVRVGGRIPSLMKAYADKIGIYSGTCAEEPAGTP